jgi:hypothetical protein
MSSPLESLHTLVTEPYLGLSRWLTVRTLDRKARQCASIAAFDAEDRAWLLGWRPFRFVRDVSFGTKNCLKKIQIENKS